MKSLTFAALAAALFAGPMAQAKVMCVLNAQSQTEKDTYDRPLFFGEVTDRVYLIFRPDHPGEVVQLSDIESFKDWDKANGAQMVTFSRGENGDYSITSGRINLSKSDNALSLDGLASGQVTKDHALNLIVPKRKIGAICSETE